MIAKIYLKWTIGIILLLFLLASYGVISMYIEVQEVKSRLNQKDFNDLLYDPGNLVIIHVDEQEEYCKHLLYSPKPAEE